MFSTKQRAKLLPNPISNPETRYPFKLPTMCAVGRAVSHLPATCALEVATGTQSSCVWGSSSAPNSNQSLAMFWERSQRKGSYHLPIKAMHRVMCIAQEEVCSSQVMGSSISRNHRGFICLNLGLNQTHFSRKTPLSPENFTYQKICKEQEICKSHESLLQCWHLH